MSSVNDYDGFAALRQQELQNGQKRPHRFVEKPAMHKLLPDLTGKRVLMLGCGTGEESLLLKKCGAADLTGVDLSAKSVKLAKSTYPEHQFKVGDMHQLDFADASFDFVYSSLTIHYSSRPLDVYQEVFRVLKPSGVLQFSVGHPVRWASEVVDIDDTPTRLLGYSENQGKARLYGNYNAFAEYQETFRNGEKLQYWIGPPSMHFALLKQAGFCINDFVETRAIAECEQADPYYYERFSRFPQFAIFVAQKSAAK